MKKTAALLISLFALTAFSQPILNNDGLSFDETIALFSKLNRFDVPQFGKPVTIEMKEPVQKVAGWILFENADRISLLTFNGVKTEVTKLYIIDIQNMNPEQIAERDVQNKRSPSMVHCPYRGCETVKSSLKASWLREIGRDDLCRKVIAYGSPFDVKTTGEAFANLYFNEMLSAYSIDRDYKTAIEFATYVDAPEYENFQYREVAVNLAKQLRRRTQDFKKLTIPDSSGWQKIQRTLSRKKQIAFLIDRLHLLNCMQTSQPGGIFYEDVQKSIAFSSIPRIEQDPYQNVKKYDVINPFVEIRNMKLSLDEAEILLPHLANQDYIPSYSFWRDFSDNRVLHKFNWLIADLLYDITNRHFIDFEKFDTLSDAGNKKEIEHIRTWMRQHKPQPMKR
ncbi:hypothetical protein [Flavobacterium selenitireducens]|uniref:hypothetical protein n=1 Tax=Flavobacterium selenitireducens TaxID=2722704 RepID=UPI00168BAF09|nr:hypothetical protein [Flavobacterium selenitireducens]MBD3581961.1 hypothetical protein [Flavobacterium selenitireducens]